jgi:8-oxo-dGTP pyrophosphatase MutT (NUDIX family)
MPVRTARAPRVSAGVVVVRRTPAGWRFLLLRAYRNWDFPKGVVEPGEEPLAAARREVREETLIDDLRFTWGEQYCETAPYGNNKVARYYLGETHAEHVTLPVSAELGRPEHNEARWVDFAAALSLSSPRVAAIVRWAGVRLGIAQDGGA